MEDFEGHHDDYGNADEFEELTGDDLYSSAIREDLLDSDSISPEEEAFMDGYDAA